MSTGAVHVCGNCGAPLELDDKGTCRWCHASVQARRSQDSRTRAAKPAFSWNWRFTAIAAAGVAIAAGLGTGIAGYAGSHQQGPPPAVSDTAPAQPAIAPGETALQQLKQDFGPWRQLAGAGPSGTALLLLDHGGTYASTRWTVPGGTSWTQDIGGNVASVQVTGGRAAITDADSTSYTVGINEPFIDSGNPGTVLMVSPDGTVLSMSLAQATALRQPLRK